MSKGLIDAILDSIFDADFLGRHGEKLTEKELKLVNFFGRKGKTLRNLYIPKDNGDTSEIDVVYITQKGIFVFESKNYSGWIFGDEKGTYWTVMLPNREKNRFYNPIKQNRTHIKWLSNYIGSEIPLFSIIVFSERCELKKVTVENDDIKVIQRDRTYATVRDIWESVPDVLTEEEVSNLYDKLKKLTDVDAAVKEAHVASIKERYTPSSKPDSPKPVIDSVPADNEQKSDVKICPRCGRELVLRTTKKGPNAGQQFYGCSGFPKCRYTEKI
ncbi:MAG: NERD domain-containing protein [Eubacterium sp.]|nr:NERD domain-containing protein [Eubacterium sp.]